MITTLIGVTSGVKPTQPSTPQKPSHTQSSVPEVVNSPPVPTPSKLSRYLEHAETKLGVSNARMFETGLSENGYGPDILHLVDNKDLEGLGISKGNIIRLKAGAQNWWNSPDAKRKRTESESAGNSDVTVTPSKQVAYEVRYKDVGSSRLFGPRLSPGPPLRFPDGEVYYKISSAICSNQFPSAIVPFSNSSLVIATPLAMTKMCSVAADGMTTYLPLPSLHTLAPNTKPRKCWLV
ncbi:hypothetical protein R3P38DRAFT_2567142 [Favolaschia claudopus]|uniref:SAM domain-containing protein n=1 Tax=Favolaschia claudopus TaxID=2862362 RepID=A0AAV9ZWK3_9AGAR